jgi:excisionase family DNA binding protein
VLTVKQAAEKLQVTPERIRNMIYAGVLPAEKFGNNWSIPCCVVEQRLAQKPKRGRPKKVDSREKISYHFISLNSALYSECESFINECGEHHHVLLAGNKKEQEFFMLLQNFFLQKNKRCTLSVE